jgi:superfamily I DNA and RNA helicase
MEIVVTTGRWKNDPASRTVVEYLEGHQADLSLSDAVLYYDFPAYADYESSLIRPDILLFSPRHGFLAIRSVDESLFRRSKEGVLELDAALGDFASNLYSRLIRSRELRVSRTQAVVDIYPIIFTMNGPNAAALPTDGLESHVCGSLEAIGELLNDKLRDPFPAATIAEIRSVVEGAKALTRPQRRIIEDPVNQPLAAAMDTLEREITNFDQKQRHIALVDVGGPARIRGLAGSGKTVILAMKAAHLHLNDPEAVILFTFYTKSLRATIKNLITRFYRHYSESDPDWKRVQIRHGWGGSAVPGVYSDASRRAGSAPLALSEANRLARRGQTAFGAACEQLLQTGAVKPFYDHVLIDEGQDFPDTFYKLCFQLAKGDRDKKSIVWAYDELQDILNVKIRQPDELFGRGGDGQPLVDLDRSSAHLPPGATNDAVLSRAYRNQRDVLVSAHAMGFGVYGTIVQMLESKEHWEDVGYEVLTGPLKTGHEVAITRPSRNSPIEVPTVQGFPLLDWFKGARVDEEVAWVVATVQTFIEGGLAPEEILIISLDDRHAKPYLAKIAEGLSFGGIASNNVIADPYNEPPFTISGKVTLSTVYRAKGNEAAVVFAVGVDAVETKSRDGRNKLFTAFTRSKAWLRVSGIGDNASETLKELKIAYDKSPSLEFVMPDLQAIETIQRGFSKKQAAARAAKEAFVKKLRAAGFSDEEIEEELQQALSGD